MTIGQQIFYKLYKSRGGDERMIDVNIEKDDNKPEVNIRQELGKLSSSDSECNLYDYLMDVPEEEASFTDDILVARRLNGRGNLNKIKIYTTDSVADEKRQWFEDMFSYISRNYPGERVGSFRVADVEGIKLAYSYQEGGMCVIYMVN